MVISFSFRDQAAPLSLLNWFSTPVMVNGETGHRKFREVGRFPGMAKLTEAGDTKVVDLERDGVNHQHRQAGQAAP